MAFVLTDRDLQLRLRASHCFPYESTGLALSFARVFGTLELYFLRSWFTFVAGDIHLDRSAYGYEY